MTLSILAVLFGLVLLIWSANRFVDGAASIARIMKVSPLIIGMVIVGFGTSAPEMIVSAFAAFQKNPGIALGNAYGSNIANIALILGITAFICPIKIESKILRKELPILIVITLIAAWQLWRGSITRWDASLLLLIFSGLISLAVWEGIKRKNTKDTLSQEMAESVATHKLSFKWAWFWLVAGLCILALSSRILVWGAVNIAQYLGVSDLIIGLTIVAIGTSLPELASSLAAIKKNEHDLVVGNIIGSNIFNTLAVVGIAGVIHPITVSPEIFYRDMMMVMGLTFGLYIFSYGLRKKGVITRPEGLILLLVYAGYTAHLVHIVMKAQS